MPIIANSGLVPSFPKGKVFTGCIRGFCTLQLLVPFCLVRLAAVFGSVSSFDSTA
jgi:hypothetical protein